MKISIVRGAFLNPYELQNFSRLKDKYEITVFSSLKPISSQIDLPLKKLFSPTDLPNFPFKYPILNRIFVDAQKLGYLEKNIEGSDIVHVAETYFGYTYQAVLAKRRGKIRKIISTVWEVIPFNNEGIKGRKRYKKLARENIDHFLAVTEKAKSALIKEGVPSEKISVINMGIDVKRFKPDFSRRSKRHLNILCVARLVTEKGIIDLQKAFLKLREKNPKLRLTFVGSGPLRRELLGYKDIFIKSVPYSRIEREYQKADIFCLPSRETKTWQEQYGMCLLEAMSCGLPIVTTDSGAIPEVCQDAALITRHSSPETLRANLEKLIYNDELRNSLSRKARLRAIKMYDRRKIARQIAKLYKQVTCR